MDSATQDYVTTEERDLEELQSQPAPAMMGFLPNTYQPKATIYATTFKKGHIVQTFHFEFTGSFADALAAAKAYLQNNHLKHIHTVPFLVDLNIPLNYPNFDSTG